MRWFQDCVIRMPCFGGIEADLDDKFSVFYDGTTNGCWYADNRTVWPIGKVCVGKLDSDLFPPFS
jgi:hypothetical protein